MKLIMILMMKKIIRNLTNNLLSMMNPMNNLLKTKKYFNNNEFNK